MLYNHYYLRVVHFFVVSLILLIFNCNVRATLEGFTEICLIQGSVLALRPELSYDARVGTQL